MSDAASESAVSEPVTIMSAPVRLDYDIAAVQYKIRQAALPEKLAVRLGLGK